MEILKTDFGKIDDREVNQYTMRNACGMEVSVIDYGAIITTITIPGKNGAQNVVLGYDDLDGYVTDPYYVGAVIGRVAGRIHNGRFCIDNTDYQLAQNDGASGNHLHGGAKGFNQKLFALTGTSVTNDEAIINLSYQSPHLEEGYPGNLEVSIRYILTAKNELIIRYNAFTDKATYVNLTNHSYFNLSGKRSSALNQLLMINADRFLDANSHYIPTGLIKPVDGSVHDFRKSKIINPKPDTLPLFNEYFILDKDAETAAELRDIETGRSMRLTTSMPGLIFYSGDFLGSEFVPCQGICLETQYLPDAPNQHPDTVLLNPSQKYEHTTAFSFSW